MQTVRGVYRLGWLDAVVEETDRRTGALVLGTPPPHLQDTHTRASVLLGNMMVSDITQRLREHDLPVRPEHMHAHHARDEHDGVQHRVRHAHAASDQVDGAVVVRVPLWPRAPGSIAAHSSSQWPRGDMHAPHACA
jgi:hypothetical protein